MKAKRLFLAGLCLGVIVASGTSYLVMHYFAEKAAEHRLVANSLPLSERIMP